jgi:hypothetical protein
MNFWLHLEKGAKTIAIFPRGNTIPFPKIRHRLAALRRFQAEGITLA